MKSRHIAGLLVVLSSFSCDQQSPKGNPNIAKDIGPDLEWNSGVKIKNGIGRGVSFIDSLGTEYGHGHLTNTITNDSTISMNLQLELSAEYHFPAPYDNRKYKVIIWPQELTSDDVTAPDSISNELRNFLAYGTDSTYTLNISLEPQEKYTLTFGTLQQYPTNCYVSPNMLFIQNDVDNSSRCRNLIAPNLSTNPPTVLRLRLDFPNVGCTIIPLGQISFGKH